MWRTRAPCGWEARDIPWVADATHEAWVNSVHGCGEQKLPGVSTCRACLHPAGVPLASSGAYPLPMCRNIRQLHNFAPPATTDEVHAAALQYVRKVAGSTAPSQANRAAFDEAVEAVEAATAHLLEHLVTTAPPKDREVEAARARARNAARFGTPA